MKTLAHEFLDIERECGFEVDQSCYDNLNDLLKKAKERIDVRKDPISVLEDIASLLAEEEFKHRIHNPWKYSLEEEDDNLTFNRGLKTKKIECRHYSVLYYTIGEELGLPLDIVLSRNHLFIRWNNGREINWETTTAKFLGNLNYIIEDNISEKSIAKGVYLRNLTREEIKAIAFLHCGIVEAEKGNIERAISDFDRAISFNPKYTTVYLNRGIVRMNKGDLDRAISDFDRLIELDPNCAKAYLNRGVANELKHSLDKAKEDYARAKAIDPIFSRTNYHIIGK